MKHGLITSARAVLGIVLLLAAGCKPGSTEQEAAEKALPPKQLISLETARGYYRNYGTQRVPLIRRYEDSLARVADAGGPPGAYAELRVLPAEKLVVLPDDVDDRTAAAAMLISKACAFILQPIPTEPGEATPGKIRSSCSRPLKWTRNSGGSTSMGTARVT